MKSDSNWLKPWFSKLKRKVALELGCGKGLDTAILAKLSASLIACDLNPLKEEVGYSNILAVDHSKPLPFKDNEFDVIVASLCLHYFSWQVTEDVISEVSRVLNTNGLLICRLNSTNDRNYGAYGYQEIEPNYYNVNGQSKRFFAESDIRNLFSNRWKLIGLNEKSIDRYEKEKVIWEFGAIRAVE